MDNKNIKLNYFKAYDKLYSIGYHSKLKNHGQRYATYLSNEYKFNTILDIGCSNGMAVNKFFRKRKIAYGIDVSDIAIRYAAEKAFVPNCIMASATNIPFVNNFVDAIFSCDVLEHLVEKDVYKALREIHRVTNKYFFVVLDCKPEGNREWIEKAKIQFPDIFGDIDNLHITIWDEHRWTKEIRSVGFNLITHNGDLYIFEKK